MVTLTGEHIRLRALEPEDLDFVYAVENDERIWHVSNTNTPYSRFLIKQYLSNAHQDIFEAKQLRLAICFRDQKKPIGLIDLFEYDPRNHRAGVGILIHEREHRNKGVGAEALALLVSYAFSHLNLHQLYANIDPENEASIRLFTNFGFLRIGVKAQWNLIGGTYRDEALYQLINHQF
ncbi:MAG: GNAT family N-acetyltransferase [Flavobacterium sp. BFFFF1]|uniref:GNAT family N-acetyltransferase n=1 Tax=unclassified Flavobacterium TaxID=196869 RepID=UPI000BD5BA92|nr:MULTISPECIES: GNAT family N-acetyltransferase [unclassified Flavobacterium]OYU81957.1 MAG: GNAT family N-acetyltransferase [Flavobacterium sp. BFFFF1]